MVDHPHLSEGNSSSSPSRHLHAEFGVSSAPAHVSTESEKGSSSDARMVGFVGGSSVSSSSESNAGLFQPGIPPDQVSEIFKAAQQLSSNARLEVAETRRKNLDLMEYITALGHSVQDVNDFMSKSGRHPTAQVVDDENFRLVNLAGQVPLGDSVHTVTGVHTATRSDTGYLPALAPDLAELPATLSVTEATVDSKQGKGKEVTADGPASCSLLVRQSSPNPAGFPGKADFLHTPNSWANVVTANSMQPTLKLKFFPPKLHNGSVSVCPPAAVLQHGNSLWNTCLVGSFSPFKLPFKFVEATAFRLWGQFGLSKVLLLDKDGFLFKFSTRDACLNVLALGPWFMASKPLQLQLWKEGFDFCKADLSRAPVWVKFHHIPLSYWTSDGLSYLASAIGKPLFVDKQTERLEPMNFARVCIEIQASSPLPDSILATVLDETENIEKTAEVRVEYQSKPPSCQVCNLFGHSHLKCPKANFQWVPKAHPPASVSGLQAGIDTGTSSIHEQPVLNAQPTSDWTMVMKGPKASPPPSKVPVDTLIRGSKLCSSPSPNKDLAAPSSNPFSPIAGEGGLLSSDEDSPPLHPLVHKLLRVDEKEERDQALQALPTSGMSKRAKKRNKGLIETRVKANHASFVANQICGNWKWHYNYDCHYNGRIWVGWNPSLWNVSIISQSDQYVHCLLVSTINALQYCVTFVYGLNSARERRQLWADLQLLASSMVHPWCILGDFNQVRSCSEIHGGSSSWDVGMQDLQDCLANCALADLRMVGSDVTWWNSQVQNPLHKKLDRVLVNALWLTSLACSQVVICPRGLSDHNPLVVQTGISLPSIPKPFQFFNYMLELENFHDIVGRAWNCEVQGDPITSLVIKLKGTRKALIALNKRVGNIPALVRDAKSLLLETQTAILENPSDPSLLHKETLQKTHLWEVSLMEEKLLKQKSRVQWLKEGDSNSGFFFNQLSQRWNCNKILSIQDEEGTLHHGHEQVVPIAVDYFQSLLGSSQQVGRSDVSQLASLFVNKVTERDSCLLTRPITDDDVWTALKSMKQNKSPGPDGFNVNFFVHTWDIVGKDFTLAVKSFFDRGCHLKGTNSTAIVLVPKVLHPTTMNDFRPISCCNTFYKCVSKIIAERLKTVLPQIISPFQAAFIPGRSIGDNILIAQDLFRNYHRRAGPPRCALKIDLRKAFDSVQWSFLLESLELFGFPPKFVYWIKACITTPMFSVKVNGALCGYFKGTRGLRQGDPLSPYLFVIVMEVLSLILSKATSNPQFHHHWRTGNINLSHLLFADDLIIFCKADLSSIRIIKDCLDLFSIFSGLNINYGKSQCYLANVNAPTQEAIISLLRFQLGSLPAKFLGIPLLTTRPSLADCQPLLDRVRNRVASWTNKLLSYAGRLQLIKSILFAIQAYWSAHLILPSKVLQELQSILSRFLWKGSSLNKYGAKVAWDSLATPYDEGGLGVKHLKDWNQAHLLFKLWQLVNPFSTSIWAKWVRNTILRDKHFWIMPIPGDCSWTWRKILQVRRIAAQHIFYIVGNGANISLWFDPWINHAPLASSPRADLVRHSGLGENALVQDIIQNGTWDLPSSNHTDIIDFRHLFTSHRSCHPNLPDQLLWGSSRMASIKVRHIWDTIRSVRAPFAWAKVVWHRSIPPRMSFHLWLCFLNKLQTKDKLLRLGLDVSPTCTLCWVEDETFHHLFFDCRFSYQLMFIVLRQCGWRGSSRHWPALTAYMLNEVKKPLERDILLFAFAAVVYTIWKERNSRAHNEDHRLPARTLANHIIFDLKCKLVTNTRFQKIKHRIWFRRFAL